MFALDKGSIRNNLREQSTDEGCERNMQSGPRLLSLEMAGLAFRAFQKTF
jgi:hypothetical protein